MHVAGQIGTDDLNLFRHAAILNGSPAKLPSISKGP